MLHNDHFHGGVSVELGKYQYDSNFSVIVIKVLTVFAPYITGKPSGPRASICLPPFCQ